MKHRLQRPDEPGSTGGGAATATPAATATATTTTPAATATPAASTATATEPPKGNWPENWRDLASRGDAKVAERLARHASPESLVESWVQAHKRISEGQLLPVLGKDPTAEEIKEWRSAHGIPESPDKYDLGTFKPNETGKPMVDKFLAIAHGSNQTPEQVQATLKFVAELNQETAAFRAEEDERAKVKYEDTMRGEWGDRYRMHDNMIHGLLDGEVTQEAKAKLLDSRLPDGTLFKNSPDMMRLLAKMALIKNPAATVVPSAANPLKGVEDRIAEIEKMMKTDRKAYFANAKIQAEYRECLDARQKLQAQR